MNNNNIITNYKIEKKENINELKDDIEIKEEDFKKNKVNTINNLFDFNNKTFKDILLFYNNNNDSELPLEDINYYIYHLKRNKGANGKYTDKFKNLLKGMKYE